jgi:hypothetical protein
MAAERYFPPSSGEQSFHCPYCGVYAYQSWLNVHLYLNSQHINLREGNDLKLALCGRCQSASIWFRETMIVPDGGSAPLSHPDMPADVKVDFDEARGIVARSPKGAAAMLRLGIQKLVSDLGENGSDLNTAIGNLVKKGLPSQVQKALDTVRVIGNEAVHPGQIDLNDKPELAMVLFDLVNIIVEEMIAKPKMIAALYNSLPKSKLDSIEKRDK